MFSCKSLVVAPQQHISRLAREMLEIRIVADRLILGNTVVTGVTQSEAYLGRLSLRSFLSLWSFPNLYRDQGKKGKGHGKELCDLLVVFGDDVLIFSDKEVLFPDSGDIIKDWSRWFSRAIKKSAEQIWGAERWIKEFPQRIFLDRECTKKFPLSIPSKKTIKIHRIVVAHGVSSRCKQYFGGGSGSLILTPSLVGDEHTEGKGGVVFPFSVGTIDPQKGLVHVLDDTSLEVLMSALDTISDFVEYLRKKEEFIQANKLASAPGEEELLAIYLGAINQQSQHDFVLPQEFEHLLLTEGIWKEFSQSDIRRKQIEHNSISYWWDGLIEQLSSHVIDGTQYWPEMADMEVQEKMMRLLAREPRWIRRHLATWFLQLKAKTTIDQTAARVFRHGTYQGRFFLFFLMPLEKNQDKSEYRKLRLERIDEYAAAIKDKFPDVEELICVATETGFSRIHSFDTLAYSFAGWTEEDRASAHNIRMELGLLQDVTEQRVTATEYPQADADHPGVEITEMMVKNYGNMPCPCGSGKHFSACHGKTRAPIS